MQTFVLSPHTENLPIKALLTQVGTQSLAIQDVNGKLVAFVLSPAEHEALALAEARSDLDLHREQVQAAMQRRGGISTRELLEKARAAADRQSQQ